MLTQMAVGVLAQQRAFVHHQLPGTAFKAPATELFIALLPAVQGMMKKALQKVKPKKQLVVAKGGRKGVKGRPRGVKGKYNVIIIIYFLYNIIRWSIKDSKKIRKP